MHLEHGAMSPMRHVGTMVILMASVLAKSDSLAEELSGYRELRNEDPDFSLRIPEDFEPYDYLARFDDARTRNFVDQQTLYKFNKGGNPSAGNFTGIFIAVEHSSWRLVRGLDVGVNLVDTEFETVDWQGRSIRLLRLERTYTTLGDRLVVLTAVVPVSGGPIQLKLTGDISDETTMRRLLRMMLDSLEAQASIFAYMNWLLFGCVSTAIGWIGVKLRRRFA